MMMHCQEQQRDPVSMELEKPYIVEVLLSTPYGNAVSSEDLRKAIQYLNSLPGGIEKHRDPKKVFWALEHRKIMRNLGRLDINGLPRDFTLTELQQSLIGRYAFRDLERVVKDCIEEKGFSPSPEEFEIAYEELKGRLEDMLAAAYLNNEKQSVQIQRTAQEVHYLLERSHYLLERNHYLLEDNTSLVSENAALSSENARLRLLLQQTNVF